MFWSFRSAAFTLLLFGEAVEVEAEAEGVEKAIFFTLHSFAGSSGLVIVAAEVKYAVDDVADDFALPGGAVFDGLADGFVDADENIADDA